MRTTDHAGDDRTDDHGRRDGLRSGHPPADACRAAAAATAVPTAGARGAPDAPPAADPALLDALARELGSAGLLRGADVGERHACDWTRKQPQRPVAVARPASTAEVAAVLRLCHAARQPVVVQGGLTGLAGGATPRPGELALSLERLAGVEHVDADAGTLLVRAGTPLAAVQDAAAAHGLAFPLDLGARGSCTIGGNLATNAGGNRVIRYGMTRELVLGVEAVLADGTVLSSLNAMLKNNAGYDLKHLFVGTEGTLGVVTRAVLRLHAQPAERLTALVALESFADLVALLASVRRGVGGALSAFEAMWSDYYEFALAAQPGGVRPFAGTHSHYALVEVEAHDAVRDAERLEAVLGAVLESGRAADVVVARSLEEAARLWRIRDGAGELLRTLAPLAAYDVSLPIARMPAFIEQVRTRFDAEQPGRALFVFGHLGDGNLHLMAALRAPEEVERADAIVYGALAGFGSVSAEHGIGTLKRAWLPASRNPAEIALMRALKAQLDPRGILNPGRVI